MKPVSQMTFAELRAEAQRLLDAGRYLDEKGHKYGTARFSLSDALARNWPIDRKAITYLRRVESKWLKATA